MACVHCKKENNKYNKHNKYNKLIINKLCCLYFLFSIIKYLWFVL